MEQEKENNDHPDLDPKTAGAFTWFPDGKIKKLEPKDPNFYGGKRDKIGGENHPRLEIDSLLSEISKNLEESIKLDEKIDILIGHYERLKEISLAGGKINDEITSVLTNLLNERKKMGFVDKDLPRLIDELKKVNDREENKN